MISILYSVYGLSYFLMGFSILIIVPKKSRFRIARALPFLGWFGVLYGISEWLSFFVKKYFIIEFLYFILIISSFIFLYCFSIELLSFEYKDKVYFSILKYSFPIIWIFLFLNKIINSIDLSSVFHWGEFYGRIIFVFVSGIIAFLGFWKEGDVFREQKLEKFVFSVRFSGIGLFLNGIFSGLFSQPKSFLLGVFSEGVFKKRIGFPVEIIRVIVAVLMTYFIIRLLKLFKWESEKMKEEFKVVLKEKKEFFENVFSASVDAFIIVDKEGVVEEVNERMLEMTGFNREKLIGESMDRFFYLPDKKVFEDIKKREKEFPLMEEEFYILGKKGEKIPVISGISNLDRSRYIITCHDMREVQRLMGELRRMNLNLEEEVRKRTKELEKKNKELEEKLTELERWQKLSVDRELRMIELKKKIKELEEKNEDRV